MDNGAFLQQVIGQPLSTALWINPFTRQSTAHEDYSDGGSALQCYPPAKYFALFLRLNRLIVSTATAASHLETLSNTYLSDYSHLWESV
jgi:hypothetical protein